MFIGKTNIALHEATNTSITHINTNLSLIKKDCFFLDTNLANISRNSWELFK